LLTNILYELKIEIEKKNLAQNKRLKNKSQLLQKSFFCIICFKKANILGMQKLSYVLISLPTTICHAK